jgi:hypothetical protein
MTERMAGRVPVPDGDRPWVACIRRPAAVGAGMMNEFGLLQENVAERGFPFPADRPSGGRWCADSCSLVN